MANNAELTLTSRNLWTAYYRDIGIPEYAGNPLIETLPPLYDAEQVRSQLRYRPSYREADCQRPQHERLHLLLNVVRFFQPLPQHFELERGIARMIRSGYVGRNPAQPGYWPESRQKVRSVRVYRLEDSEPMVAQGLSLVGISGTGKSRAINRIAHMYPQCICHSRYRHKAFTHLQLVWLKLDCPQDGSLTGLARDFFVQVDRVLHTNYYHRYAVTGHPTLDTLIISMANVCLLNSLGVLIIDEVQNLRQAHGEAGLRLLNFLTQLDNTIGVPIILVGTPAALPALTGEFRRARRAEGAGEIPWDRMLRQGDGEWDLFLETLWQYQYIAHPCKLTTDLSDAMYDEAQGIADIAIKLFLLTQVEAIRKKKEEITERLIRETAAERFRYVQSYIAKLRARGFTTELYPDSELDDITMPSRLPDLSKIVDETIDELKSQAPDVSSHPPDSASGAQGADGDINDDMTTSPVTDSETPLARASALHERPHPTRRRSKQQGDQQTQQSTSTQVGGRRKGARSKRESTPYESPETQRLLRSATEFSDAEAS